MGKKKSLSNEQTTCPCAWQSGRGYDDCCGRYIDDAAQAPTAEALMRSRYSAFVRENAAYLLQTWHQSTRPASLDFEPTQWLGLSVESTEENDANHARVIFSARYKIGGRAYRLHENSAFVRENGVWFYVDGDVNN